MSQQAGRFCPNLVERMSHGEPILGVAGEITLHELYWHEMQPRAQFGIADYQNAVVRLWDQKLILAFKSQLHSNAQRLQAVSTIVAFAV